MKHETNRTARLLVAAGALVTTATLSMAPAHAATDPNKITLDKTVHFRAGELLTGGGAGGVGVPVRFSWSQDPARYKYICKQSFTVGREDFRDDFANTSAPWAYGVDYRVGTGLGGGADIWEFQVTEKMQSICNSNPGTLTSAQGVYTINPPEQENSRTVSFSGTGWVTENSTGYSGNAAKVSHTPGDKVTFTYGGNSSAFITNLGGPGGHGKANVYIDGSKKATIDLAGTASQKWRYIGYSWYQDTTATHTMTIEVVSGKIAADAFLYAAPYVPRGN